MTGIMYISKRRGVGIRMPEPRHGNITYCSEKGKLQFNDVNDDPVFTMINVVIVKITENEIYFEGMKTVLDNKPCYVIQCIFYPKVGGQYE